MSAKSTARASAVTAALAVSTLSFAAPAMAQAPDAGPAQHTQAATSHDDRAAQPVAKKKAAKGTRYTDVHLNVRTGGGMQYRVVTTVEPGTAFDATGKTRGNGSWTQVDFNGKKRYVATRYLTDDAPAQKSSTASSSAKKSTPKKSTPKKSNSSSRSTSPSRSTQSSASSSNAGVWDKLAQCESGGNWSINTGNGYYGGLQFSPSSWRAAGGSGMPHQASKAEQIRVAENLQDMQGWGAWPACSAKLGLR